MKMAKLSDVQEAQNGTVDSGMASYIPPVASNGDTKYKIYKLANHNGKGTFSIDGIDDVIDPTTITKDNPRGKTSRIRLLTGVDSIWQKDQKELTKEYIEKNRRSLVFENKVCRLPEWDTAAIEFATHTRHRLESPSYRKGSYSEFFEWNPEKQAEEANKKKLLKIKAMTEAINADVEKMRKHALYLGVLFTDEVGLPKTDEQLRPDYIMKAEENPEGFMNSLNDPIVSISYIVKKAIRDSKIDIGRQPNMAHWAAGGVICHIPKSRQAAEYLIEYANTNSEDGKKFLDQLQTVTT